MNELIHKLNTVEAYATGSKLARMAHNPLRYLHAMVLLKLIYPITHKGSLKKTTLFFGGEMQILLPAATDIYLSGAKTHSSEIRLARYMANTLKNGDVYIDIGAHFGYFTLLAATLVGKQGIVYGIEPAKGTFELLSKNVASKENIVVYHNAVSDKNEVVSFYEFPALYSEYNSLHIEKFKSESWMQKYKPQKTEVSAITIDGFMLNNNIEQAVIKIDVEGAEVQAIAGGLQTWEDGKSIVILEYLDEEDSSSYTNAADILYKQGYTSYMIDNKGELTSVTNILTYMREHNTNSENIVFKKKIINNDNQ